MSKNVICVTKTTNHDIIDKIAFTKYYKIWKKYPHCCIKSLPEHLSPFYNKVSLTNRQHQHIDQSCHLFPCLCNNIIAVEANITSMQLHQKYISCFSFSNQPDTYQKSKRIVSFSTIVQSCCQLRLRHLIKLDQPQPLCTVQGRC